jgi:membrane fusion protein (multidrug efflux system)
MSNASPAEKTKKGLFVKRLILLLLLGMASSAVFADEQAQAPRPSLVVTAPVVQGMVNPLQNYVGTLYYDRKSEIASEFEGIVSSLEFREGQRVRKGDALVRLDSKVLEANIDAKASALKALEAELTRQTRDLDRSKALFERNSISQSNYDQVFYTTEQLRAQAAAIRSELKAMHIQLEKNSIKAPFDAVIAARNVDIGEWVGKGDAIATLIAEESIEARLNIPASLIDALRSSTHFAATIEGRDVDVTLKTVIPVADAVTRTFPVELDVPKNMGLIEGMRIDVRVPTLKRQESLLVPRDALIKRFGQTVVFAAVDGKAVMIPVQVIGYETDTAAVSGAGLNAQMRVVIKGNERIFANMPVTEKVNP